mgnify:CR=1 FL=1
MTEKNRQWYTVQTYSGYENKVKADLDQRISTMGMGDKIFRVLVPTETRDVKVVDKDGKPTGKTRRVSHKLFPSYVFVEMLMDDQSWYAVRHTPGVTGFVGAGNRPLPVTAREMNDILTRLGEIEPVASVEKVSVPEVKTVVEIDCNVGDKVRVVSGTWIGKESEVIEINQSRGTITIMVSLFGRETETEVSYTECKKL